MVVGRDPGEGEMGTHCLMGTKFQFCQMKSSWDSLAVQWLELCASTAGGMGLIPGQGTEILQATQHGQKQKKKKKKSSGDGWCTTM